MKSNYLRDVFAIALLFCLSAFAATGRPPIVNFPPYQNFPRLVPAVEVSIAATFKSEVTPPNAAEYHCINKSRIFVVSGSPTRSDNTLHVYDISPTLGLTGVGNLSLTLPGDEGVFGEPNSCAVVGGKVYVVVTPFGEIGRQPGKIIVFDADTLEYIADYEAGYNPDHVFYSPDHRFIVTADEGEPPQEASDPATNPIGGATILDTETGEVCSFQIDFTGYTDEELKAFRLHKTLGDEISFTNDMEPEYVSFDPQDNTKAFITLQEANAIMEITIDPELPCNSDSRVVSLRSLGWKDYRGAFPNSTIATTDRFANKTKFDDNVDLLQFKNSPVYGNYQPDGTKGFVANGKTYFITANEGDSKDDEVFGTGVDEAQIDDLSLPLSSTADWNPYTHDTVDNEGNMKRLKVLAQEGLNEDGTEYDFLVAEGGRGFAIWSFENGETTLVYESGDSTELELAQFMKQSSTSDQRTEFVDRARRKGSEPEGVAAFTTPKGRTIALVSFERASAIGFYDVTNPAQPQTVVYVTHPSLMGPEAISIIEPANSPSGKYLLVANGEGSDDDDTSQRLMVFELELLEGTSAPTQSPSEKGGASNSHVNLVISLSSFAFGMLMTFL